MSVNKVILIGNLGRDPEMNYSQSGAPVVRLSVATSRVWRDKQTQEKNEEVEWHRVTVFGKTAEACNSHLTKGRQVYVEGRLQTRSYDDKDGIKRYSTEVIADTVQFLGARGENDGGGGRRHGGYGGRGNASGDGAPKPYDPGDYSPVGRDEDDIPF